MDLISFLVLFFVFYVWHILGTTIGYHRLLAHRTFKCPKVVEYFWVLGGYTAWEASPIWWATMHRAHHRFTDVNGDPHAPRFGFFNAYMGWFLKGKYEVPINPYDQAKDLTSDRFYCFLEQNGNWHRAHLLNSAIGFGFRVVLLLVFGWQVALASLLAGLVVFNVPLLLNVACHKPRLGYKTYDTEDDSVNVWWVALLTAGEGWHNNHHAFPGSARSGFKWHEFDFSWWILKLMNALGLASHLNDAMSSKNKHSKFQIDSSNKALEVIKH